MALKIPVKVDTVNNLSTARYVSGMAVDYIGIKWLGDSEEEVLALKKLLDDLSGWLSGINWVLECENLSAPILDFAQDNELKFIEVENLLGERKPDEIKVFGRVTKEADLFLMAEHSDFLIVSFETFANIESSSLTDIKIPILVSEVKELRQLADIQEFEPKYGIAITSNSEGKTGFLQDDFLMDVLEELDDY